MVEIKIKEVQNYTAWARYLSFPMSAWSSLSRSELSSSSFRGIEVAISTSSSLSLSSSAFTPGSSVFTSVLHMEHQMQLSYSNSTIYSTILTRFFFGLLLLANSYYRSVPLIRPPILYTTSCLKWGGAYIRGCN